MTRPPCTASFAASQVCGDKPMWMTRNRSTSRMPIQSHHTCFIGIVASNDRNIPIVLRKIPFSLGNYVSIILYNFKGVSQWLSSTALIFSSMSLSWHWSSCGDHLRFNFPMTISPNRITTWSNALWIFFVHSVVRQYKLPSCYVSFQSVAESSCHVLIVLKPWVFGGRPTPSRTCIVRGIEETLQLAADRSACRPCSFYYTSQFGQSMTWRRHASTFYSFVVAYEVCSGNSMWMVRNVSTSWMQT